MRNIWFSFYSIILFIFCFGAFHCNTYTGPIAGNKSISECINGNRKKYSNLQITTSEMIRKEGYPAEDHLVLTEDGYLLTLHRIPGAIGSPTVFLQHGLMSSSFDWIVLGKNKALGFLLADEGYDVWLGNTRGVLYSQCHVNYTTDERRFWNFSFHENAIYDLPAIITYISKIKKDNLIYIGHSMGTTMFYIMSIEKPDIASKVKVMFSLAPVAFLYNMKSPIRLLVPIVPVLETVINFLTAGKIFWQSPLWKMFVKYGCNMFLAEKMACMLFLNTLAGFDLSQVNYTITPQILNHYPSGTSIRTLNHFAQYIKTEKFRNYDYGFKENMKIYNNSKPPAYNLSKIQVPIGIFWSENDYLATPTDVNHLYELIPKKAFNYKVAYTKFNHLDYLWGMNAPKYLYSKIISAMRKYR